MNGFFSAEQARHMTLDEMAFYFARGLVIGDVSKIMEALTYQMMQNELEKARERSAELENVSGEYQEMEERWSHVAQLLTERSELLESKIVQLRSLLAEGAKLVEDLNVQERDD